MPEMPMSIYQRLLQCES